MTRAERLSAPLRRLFTSIAAKREAASALFEYEDQLDAADDRETKLIGQLRTAQVEKTRWKDKALIAETLSGRIDLALDDFKAHKPGANWTSPEKAVAIIISPYQAKNFRTKTYKHLPILVAAGIYGPVVVSQKGLDGLSRQAPELLLRKA